MAMAVRQSLCSGALLVLTVLAVHHFAVVQGDTKNCKPYDGNDIIRKCDNQTYFDLTTVKDANGKPLLSAIDNQNNYIYYVQFAKGGLPSNVPNCTKDVSGSLVAQVRLDGGGCYMAGKLSMSNYEYDSDLDTLTIRATGGLGGRNSVIAAKCSTVFGQHYTTLKETGEQNLQYTFQMDMPKDACLSKPPHGGGGGGGGGSSSSKSTDAGAIVLAVFFGLLGGYFIFGAVFLAAAQGKRGVEMVPNREFWISLPGLIKDGFFFTTARVKGTASRGNYAQI